MLDQANKLRAVSLSFSHSTSVTHVRQPIALFVTSADEMYGPITMLRRDNHVVKHIPWAAFKMVDHDWVCVIDARDILGVSQSTFTSAHAKADIS